MYSSSVVNGNFPEKATNLYILGYWDNNIKNLSRHPFEMNCCTFIIIFILSTISSGVATDNLRNLETDGLAEPCLLYYQKLGHCV